MTHNPLWNCPHCDLKAYHDSDLDVVAEHMWEVHGVPTEFRLNGEIIRGGPGFGPLRWLLKITSPIRYHK